MAKTLYIIDGHAHIYGAYYAPMTPLKSASSEPARAAVVVILVLFFAVPALAAQAAADEVAIRLNLPKGFSALVSVTSDSNSFNKDVPVMGDIKTYYQTIAKYQIDCLSVDRNGNMEVKQTWKSIREVSSDPNGNATVRFDSTDNRYPIPDDEIVTKAMIGQSMIFVVSPKGEILDITGYASIVKRMAPSAAKYLYLGRADIVRMLKEQTLVGLSEFCSKDLIRIGELHKETSIPNIDMIPRIVGYSKEWILNEVRDGQIDYEVRVNRVREQSRDITDFAGKRTERMHTEENEFQHGYFDLKTGFVLKSQTDWDSSSKDVYIQSQPETVREYSGNGSVIVETSINKYEDGDENSWSYSIIGMVAIIGISVICTAVMVRRRNG